MDHLRIALLSLHTCPWSRPGGRYTGGMNVYIRNLCLQLEKLGVAADVYTCCHEGNEPCNFSAPACRTGLVHINAGASGHGRTDHALDLAQAVEVYCRDRGLRYDIIHSHYWLSGLAGSYLKQMWDVPHITMFHTLGSLKNGSLPGLREPDYRIAAERSVMSSCDRIIASTSLEKQGIVSRYGADADKISVIPCGVNTTLFHPVPTPEARAACGLPQKKTLLFVGRPDPIKGLDNLLQAVSLLGRENDLQLVIAGCGDQWMSGSGQSADCGSGGLGDRVIFTGPVDHEKMYLYYNAADLCVIPSYYESFSLTALEAVSCGTPVLATCVGEIPELSRLSGLCKVVPDNR
ncbi:MAG: glycosyltransferase, partial [Dehalococcoidia bacterium]